MLEFDFTLGPLRLRLTLSTPTDADAGEYLTDSELAADDSDAPMGFHH